jgi:hypothetical protein
MQGYERRTTILCESRCDILVKNTLFTSDSVNVNGKIMKLKDYYEMIALTNDKVNNNCGHAALSCDLADGCKDYE